MVCSNPPCMHFRHDGSLPPQLTGELSMDEASDSGFISTLRVCMFSCNAMCILVVPFDSLASWACMHACSAWTHWSEQLAAIIVDMQYCSVYFSLAPRFCIIVLQDVLKKLLMSPRIGGYIVREVDLMLALQCGASMIQHTTVVAAASRWTLNNTAMQV